MSKKVKCKMCAESMRWALPVCVTDQNYEYAKHCLRAAKNTLVCGYTTRVKNIEHVQYCRHFRKKNERKLDFEINEEPKMIQNLEDMIKEYERSS